RTPALPSASPSKSHVARSELPLCVLCGSFFLSAVRSALRSRRGRRRSDVPDAPSFTREAALELLEAHGLGEAVVEPGLERPAAFVLVLAGRQRDEDRAGRPSLAAHPLTELAAAQPGKIEVEDDDPGLVDASGVE